MIKQTKIFLFFFSLFSSLLFFSYSSFAFTIASESTKIVYNDEIHTVCSIFDVDIVGGLTRLEAVRIDEDEIINFSLDFSPFFLEKDLENVHYEIDDNRDVYVIGKKDDRIIYENLSVINSPTLSATISKAPNWIDNIYPKEKVEEKINEIFEKKKIEKIIIDNTLFLVHYDGEEYTYFNTKNLKVTKSKFPKEIEKIIGKIKEVNVIGKKEHPLLIKQKSSYTLLSYSELESYLLLATSNTYDETEKNFRNILEEIKSKTFKDAVKSYFKRSKKKDGKIGEKLKKRKINGKEKEKYEKIIFKYKRSIIEKYKGNYYYSTTIKNKKYSIKIGRKDWGRIRERKDLKAYKKKDISTEINKIIEEKVIEYCKNAIGAKYSQERRTETPDYYDCSSLVYYAYKEMGINLCDMEEKPPVAADEAKYLEKLGNLIKYDKEEIDEEDILKKLKPGDLIFYSNHTNDRYMDITHVAMYIGDGKIIHASGKAKGVCEQDVYFENMVGYGNPIKKGTEWDIYEKNLI